MQQIALPRLTQEMQPCKAEAAPLCTPGNIFLRALGEQLTGLTHHCSRFTAAREQSRPTLFESWQYLEPQEVAVITRTGIAGVFNRLKPSLKRALLQTGTRLLQQGPQQHPPSQRAHARHGRQPCHPGAT